jgi:GMP synthase (glutamine-hydrolysing)
VLGICYGLHLMARELGGDVIAATKREYGPANVTVVEEASEPDDPETASGTAGAAKSDPRAGTRPPAQLFAGTPREQPVWMSHGDSIVRLPPGFVSTAQTESTPYAGIADPARRFYGIQFHP